MGPASNTVERESKLDAAPDFRMPDLDDLVQEARPRPDQDLWATYFDSDDLRLWARGITFRHRRGEDSDAPSGIWTLKLPEGTAGEILERAELTWPGRLPDVPVEAHELLRGLLRHRTLSPVAELETHRQRLLLRRKDGTVLGELDDDRVTVHGGPRDGLQFRQIEVELDSSDDYLLDRVLKRLRSAGALRGRAGPKLARALGDSQKHSASAHRYRLTRDSLLAEVVGFSLQRALATILDRDVRLRLRPQDLSVEDVHKTRVATRRLRSDLKTLRAMLDPVWTRHVRGDLKWLGSVLGEVRDLDVLQKYLEASRRSGLADAEGTAVLLSRLGRQREAASQALVQALASDRYLTLLDKLDAATTNPPFLAHAKARGRRIDPDRPAARYLPVLVRKEWKKLQASIRRSDADPTDHNLHRVRIRAKQIRYAAELAEPVVGRHARRTANTAKRVQTLIGGHQDAVVADDWLRAQLDGGTALAHFASGQLSVDQARRKRRARRQWPRARKELRQPKVRTWIRS
jgi:CHAD domain-containing protein